MLNSPVWRGLPCAAFGLGLVAGALLSAFALLVTGSLVRPIAPAGVRWALTGVVFVVITGRECGRWVFALPQNARLVPESVFRHGRFFGPFEFGVEMGSGVRTYVTSGLPYVVVVAVAFLATATDAAAAGVGFGLGRALMTFAHLGYAPDDAWDEQFDAHTTGIRSALLVGFGASLLASWLAVGGVGG